MSNSMNFATVIVAITPKVDGFPPVTFKANVFNNEEEFLSETQPDGDRARLFMANDGNAGQYIDKFAISGMRDLTIFDGPEADQLTKMNLSNPQPEFDLAFTYQRNDQLATEIRTHFHKGCKIMNHAARAMSNDVPGIRFSFKYMNYAVLNAAGQPV